MHGKAGCLGLQGHLVHGRQPFLIGVQPRILAACPGRAKQAADQTIRSGTGQGNFRVILAGSDAGNHLLHRPGFDRALLEHTPDLINQFIDYLLIANMACQMT